MLEQLHLEIIKVGIADLNIVTAPNRIRTSGLGSCVGVVIYDQLKEMAGLVHIMLPDSSLAKGGEVNKAKFADTGIAELVKLLLSHGAKLSSLRAKIAGGAQMFQFSNMSDMMRIGPRNVDAVKEQLRQLKIPIIAEDVGGHSGRTIEFCPRTKILTIRTVNKGVQEW